MKFSEPLKYLRDMVRISTRKDAGLAIQEILPVRPAHASLYDRDRRRLADGRVELEAVEEAVRSGAAAAESP